MSKVDDEHLWGNLFTDLLDPVGLDSETGEPVPAEAANLHQVNIIDILEKIFWADLWMDALQHSSYCSSD